MGDFNKDRLLDIVVADDATNSFGVLRGSGKGDFANWTTFSTAFDSLQYALDVANSGTRNVGVLLGLGDGSFVGQTTLDIDHSSTPYSIAVADVNNDTHRDILVVCSNADHFSVLLGSGNGSFALPTKYSTGNDSSPRSIAIGDFDNDAQVDIAVATYKVSSVIVYFGQGNGSFASQVVFYTSNDSHPYSIATGDFNNDARLDIAVVNYDYNYVDIVLTHRNYSFSSPRTYLQTTGYNSKPRSIAVADFNEDGLLDIVIANFATGDIFVFLNHGHNSFRNQLIHSSGRDSQPLSIAAGDFNNGLRLDIVVANYKGNGISIFLGDGNGTFLDPTIYLTNIDFRPRAVSVGDLNNDSWLDIVIAHQGTKSIGIFFGSGNGQFSSEVIQSTDDISAGGTLPIWRRFWDNLFLT